MNQQTGMGTLKVPARAGAYYTCASVISKLAGLAFTPFFTHGMTREEYGSFTLYMTVVGLVTTLCSSVISGTVLYKGYSIFVGKEKRFTSSAIALSFISSLAVSLPVLLFGGAIGIKPGFMPFLIAQLASDSVLSAYFAEKRYFYSYKWASAVTMLCAVATPILSLGLLQITASAYARVIGLLAVSAAVAAPFLAARIKDGLYDGRMWRFIVKSALPLLPGAVAHAMVAETDKLAISHFLGREALASYSVAHSVGVGLTFITGSLGSALFPWMTRKLKNGKSEEMAGTVSNIYAFLSALTVLLIGIAPEAVSLLTPQSYSVALPAILPLSLATLPSFLMAVIGVFSMHSGKSYRQSLSYLTAGILNAFCNIILVPRFEYFGAGLSLLISYASGVGIGYFLSRREIGDKLPVPSLLRSTLMTVGLCATMTVLYPYPALRVLLFTVPAIKIISSLTEMRALIFEKA